MENELMGTRDNFRGNIRLIRRVKFTACICMPKSIIFCFAFLL